MHPVGMRAGVSGFFFVNFSFLFLVSKDTFLVSVLLLSVLILVNMGGIC